MANVEIFYVTEADASDPNTCFDRSGWHYWYCFPGCIPESDPFGPFDSREAAERDLRDEEMNGCGPCPFCDLDAENPDATPEADRCDYCAVEFSEREASK